MNWETKEWSDSLSYILFSVYISGIIFYDLVGNRFYCIYITQFAKVNLNFSSLFNLPIHPWTLCQIFKNCCMALLIELKQVWVSTYLFTHIGEFTLLSPLLTKVPRFTPFSVMPLFCSSLPSYVCVCVSAFLRKHTHTLTLSSYLIFFPHLPRPFLYRWFSPYAQWHFLIQKCKINNFKK